MSVDKEAVLTRTTILIRRLSKENPNEKIKPELKVNFLTAFRLSYPFVRQRISTEEKDHLIQNYHEIQQNKDYTNGRALEILNELRTRMVLIRNSEPLVSHTDSGLEERLARMEVALTTTQPNPTLEKKVAKLEEEVKKVVMASLQDEEKEQEDILKKYKNAKKRVFVIMPFDTVFEDIWVGGIERACTSEGYCCIRVDKISLSSWINNDIEECIELADVVVTDITGANPNVMFELGWALAKGKKPVIIRQKNDSNPVPFDVHNYRYINYVDSWSGVENLCKTVSKFLKSTSENQPKQTIKNE
jgi:hypothetical protein